VRVRRPDEHDAGRERREPARTTAPRVARVLALQRSAGNQAVARAIKHNPKELGVVVYDTEPGVGTTQDLATVVQAVMQASTGLDEGDVTLALSQYDGDEAADLVYATIEDLVGYLGGELKGEEAEKKGEKEQDSGESEDEGKAETEVEEGVRTAEGQTVGKITFEGDTYHGGIKKAIIRTIGVKKLSFLVYGDKTHHNFNLWFEDDGEIFADINSPKNNKGVETGFRWDEKGKMAVEFKKAARKQGRTKERKGNKKNWDS
jgi:hypothetical protein